MCTSSQPGIACQICIAAVNQVLPVRYVLPVNQALPVRYVLPVNQVLPVRYVLPVNQELPVRYVLPVNQVLPVIYLLPVKKLLSVRQARRVLSDSCIGLVIIFISSLFSQKFLFHKIIFKASFLHVHFLWSLYSINGHLVISLIFYNSKWIIINENCNMTSLQTINWESAQCVTVLYLHIYIFNQCYQHFHDHFCFCSSQKSFSTQPSVIKINKVNNLLYRT